LADAAQTLIHTGQHYDPALSGIFLTQLSMPADVNLEVGSGSHAWHTAEVMRRIEPALLGRKPDIVVVHGDVNSTVAAAPGLFETKYSLAHAPRALNLNRRISKIENCTIRGLML